MITRKQGITLLTALTSFIAVLVVVQLWLVSAALDALLTGDVGVLVPAAIASFVLFAIDVGLLLHGLRLDRRVERGAANE